MVEKQGFHANQEVELFYAKFDQKTGKWIKGKVQKFATNAIINAAVKKSPDIVYGQAARYLCGGGVLQSVFNDGSMIIKFTDGDEVHFDRFGNVDNAATLSSRLAFD